MVPQMKEISIIYSKTNKYPYKADFYSHLYSMSACSVVSDSDHMEPARFLHPLNFPGKDTGAGCSFVLSRESSDPRIEPKSSSSPVLAGGFFTSSGREIYLKKGFLGGASGTESMQKK